LLLGLAVVCATVYVLLTFTSLWQLLYLLAVPLLVRNGLAVARTEALHTLNPWLRQMSLAALAFATLFALGQALPTIFV
jgi:1,4-dihydroxy-2-naphthoate octaprenyltransferase